MQPAASPFWRPWAPATLAGAAWPGLARVTALAVVACALGAAACGGEKSPVKPEPPVDTTKPPVVTPNASVDVSVTVDQGTPISPYIYGSNQDYAGNVWTARRLGGNRLTGYNWLNNFSNAGSDYLHQSDDYLLWVSGIPASVGPAGVITHFHDQSLAMGAASIVTLQMAGYVAADGSGPVTEAQTAPSSRWARVAWKKPGPFTLTPNVKDSVVYMDELVNFLVQKYGNAASARGVKWYSLDNEPALWPSTHVRIHPAKVGARELVDRSVALATAVKAVDPQAGILGPAAYGFAAYNTLQDAPDWPQLKGSYRWYLDYYLAEMRKAEGTAGRRLLDVLDVHWYPEAQGDHRIVDAAATTPADEDARLQAPRTLWDSTYVEKSWIAQCCRGFLPILPSLLSSIATYYPGTKLAITEYDYGAKNAISGGLAQADVLGIFGRSGVYLATLWGIGSSDAYAASAFRLYRDYDGKGGAYGSTALRASSGAVDKASAYASLEGSSTSRLHLVLINKTRAKLDFKVTIGGAGATAYSAGDVFGFDATGASIRSWTAVSGIAGNAFTYTMPPLSAAHLVLH